ncbi:hypothetical protein PINS_up022468 [Pythium insidiosum]|nr:hypothetical protein PINS_up022468 [Pythium insidiosum]
MLGQLLLDSIDQRSLIPVLTFRLHRCSKDDMKVFRHFAEMWSESAEDDGDVSMRSDLLYKLIAYSEYWETPTPSFDEMEARFLNATITTGIHMEAATHCAFTKENSTACKEYAQYASYNASPIVYKRDRYWNRAPPLPNNVSVLLLSSLLDPQTIHKYAETFFEALETENKKLVTFPHSPHGTIYGTPMMASSSGDEDNNDCGMLVLASYVAQDGDLSKTDTSCVAKVRPISFALSRATMKKLLATDAAFDGSFKMSLAVEDNSENDGGADSRDIFKTLCFVFLGMWVATIVVLAVVFIKWRRAVSRRKETELARVHESS